jgi:hypothetical protein
MPSVSSRHPIVARIAVCACAIVCVSACNKPERSADSAGSASSVSPSTTATSELQDWAEQATGQPARAAMARAASESLATPVIHTVD